MRRLRTIAFGIAAAAVLGFAALAQQSVIPGAIYDTVWNNITAQVSVIFNGSTSGSTVVKASAVAGTNTLTLPAATDTLVGKATTDSLTNKTLVAPTITGATNVTPSSFTPRLIATGAAPATLTTSGNDSTPVITETYVCEINIPYSATITGIALFNGSNVTGNVTVGLADSTGAPITAAVSASTAGSGTTAYQLVPFATPYAAIGPAKYFTQVQYSSATARYRAHHLGVFGASKQTGQTYGTLTAFTPPTTFTADLCNLASLY